MKKASIHFLSVIGAAIGIFLTGEIALLMSLDDTEITFLIGSFGASAVLIYGIPEAEFSQPRNLFGGHIISAFVGVSTFSFFGPDSLLAAPLAVSFSILAMQLTKTTHPPGGATSLIAVIGSAKIHKLGYLYVLCPVATGVLIMFAVALVTNNLRGKSFPKYPKSWI